MFRRGAGSTTKVRLRDGLLAVALGACSGAGDAERALRSDSAGVEIVVSAAPDRAMPLTLEREWTAGDAVSGGLDLLELMPWQVAADAAGRVYVLDTAGKRVFVLDGAGVARDTLGRPGEGPGELSRPVAVDVAEDGTVGVWDYGQGGMVRWRAGEPLPLLRPAATFWGPDVKLLGEMSMFVTLPGRETSRQRLVMAGADGPLAVADMARMPDRPVEFPSCGIRGIPIAPLFAPELNWAVQGNRVLASTTADYAIRVVDLDGLRGTDSQQGQNGPVDGTRAIWRRSVPARAVTEAVALREVADGLTIPRSGCTVPPHEVVKGRGYADVVPAIQRLVVDRRGRAWVLRGRLNDEPNQVDVFDATGAYLGTLAEGVPVPVAFAGSDRLIGLETDSLGVRVLASWRVRER